MYENIFYCSFKYEIILHFKFNYNPVVKFYKLYILVKD